MLLFQFISTFLQTQNGVPFLVWETAFGYSSADWDGPCDRLREVPWEKIFDLDTSITASTFYDCIQARVDGNFPYCSYQFKPHFLSMVFSCLRCVN